MEQNSIKMLLNDREQNLEHLKWYFRRVEIAKICCNFESTN